VKPNLKVVVHADQDPLTATVTFNTVIRGGDRAGHFPVQDWRLYFVVEFVLEDDQWRVYDYEMHQPQRGI